MIVSRTGKAKARGAVRLGVGSEKDAAEMRMQESLSALPLITRVLQSSQCLEEARVKKTGTSQQYW